MRAVIMYAPGDVRVEERDDPTIIEPTDAIIRLARLVHLRVGPVALPRRRPGRPHPDGPRVRRRGRPRSATRSKSIQVGDFVVGSFFASDNTCEICRAGYQSRCIHAEPDGRRSARRPSTPASRWPTAPSSPPPASPTPT